MQRQRTSGATNLRLLEYAVALDRYRGFARAAAAVGVTQPAFSRGIVSLEQSLQARLFERSSRHVRTTPEGEVFVARAAQLLHDAARLREAVTDYQNLRSGSVVVGVGPYPLDLSVIECVSRLSARHPHLRVEIVEGRWRSFGPALLNGEVDLAVVEASILLNDIRFEVEKLPPHAGCFYCRHGHPLAERKDVPMADILAYPIVGVPLPARAYSPGRKQPKLVLDQVTGDVVPNIATTSIAAARKIVARTDGVGVAALVQIEEEVALGRLVILDTDARHLATGYGIARLRSAGTGALHAACGSGASCAVRRRCHLRAVPRAAGERVAGVGSRSRDAGRFARDRAG